MVWYGMVHMYEEHMRLCSGEPLIALTLNGPSGFAGTDDNHLGAFRLRAAVGTPRTVVGVVRYYH
jgi:hypothetical protein